MASFKISRFKVTGFKTAKRSPSFKVSASLGKKGSAYRIETQKKVANVQSAFEKARRGSGVFGIGNAKERY